MNPTQSQPPAAGQAAHTLTASIGTAGAAFHCDNVASHPLSFHLSYRDPALSGDGMAFAGEILRRYSSHAALVEALERQIKHTDQLAGMVNRFADRLGLGKKVNAEDWTDQARAALQLAKEGTP